jgi:NDP-sugar pyrophosphorylase family protein
MKAILLAGGQGSRLRPLTVTTPKPVVPIFDRPFLQYQIDLIRRVPDITEIVLSLNYQPERIEAVFGDGRHLGVRLRYVVEPSPLGTGGAIKFAASPLAAEPIVVFNGDVLTTVDLGAVLARHRALKARATIVLTPVDNPLAYGLVETDASGHVRAFIEKPDPRDVRCNTINAGIYVLEADSLARIPDGVAYSIERGYFPSLIAGAETFAAVTDGGYWIDIGTPDKYRQAHRDIMDGRFPAPPFLGAAGTAIVDPTAEVARSAVLEAPCFVGARATIASGARVGAYSVIGADCRIGADASIAGAVLWPATVVGAGARVGATIAGRATFLGAHTRVSDGTALGDGTTLPDFSHV